jgi:DNA-binding HxlR family transcriptional regulator
MKWTEVSEVPCSIARGLSLVGDRWTLLILRDAFLKTRRFEDFHKQIGMTRHRLSDRLQRLVEAGVMEKQLYETHPARYEYRLTQMGRDVYPVLQALVAWGDKWLDEGHGPPLVYRHARCGKDFHARMVCSECNEPIDPREVIPTAGPGIAEKEAVGTGDCARGGSARPVLAPGRSRQSAMSKRRHREDQS